MTASYPTEPKGGKPPTNIRTCKNPDCRTPFVWRKIDQDYCKDCRDDRKTQDDKPQA